MPCYHPVIFVYLYLQKTFRASGSSKLQYDMMWCFVFGTIRATYRIFGQWACEIRSSLFFSMTTIELPPSPLPLRPPQYESWREIQPNFVSAYDAVLNAERHANERAMIGPEAKDNLISARVAGYLLLEPYNRRTTLADRPSSSLVKSIVSPSLDGGGSVDTVFAVGKFYRNILLRMCAFGFFATRFGISISLQSVLSTRGIPNPLHTLRAPPLPRCRI